ncbi:MAG: DUF6273 domain-containing protein [Oscillospiraceae bacterium]|nr:DUF6273 domain-containing protein [Oscillospiraceae bacterium]
MNKNEIIRFGRYDWQVLDAQNDRALIITQYIVEMRPYDLDFTYNSGVPGETWETCTLREYLNGEFLEKFKPEERERIIRTETRNPNNPWYGTAGGGDTYDSIFLLSLEEAGIYFDCGGTYLLERKEYDFDVDKYIAVESGSGNGGFFSNAHDGDRQANYRGVPACWWLRSPGSHPGSAAFVFDNGGIGVVGLDLTAILDIGGVGIRPALWLCL